MWLTLHAVNRRFIHPIFFSLVLWSAATVDLTDSTGRTALFYAVEVGERCCAQRLLRANATVDIQSADGCTPLMQAILFDRKGCVELLLRAGADASTLKDTFGHVAEDLAQQTPDATRCLQLLEEHAASPLAPLPWMSGLEATVPGEVIKAAVEGNLVTVACWLTRQNGDVNAVARSTSPSISASKSSSDTFFLGRSSLDDSGRIDYERCFFVSEDDEDEGTFEAPPLMDGRCCTWPRVKVRSQSAGFCCSAEPLSTFLATAARQP